MSKQLRLSLKLFIYLPSLLHKCSVVLCNCFSQIGEKEKNSLYIKFLFIIFLCCIPYKVEESREPCVHNRFLLNSRDILSNGETLCRISLHNTTNTILMIIYRDNRILSHLLSHAVP